MVYLGIVEDNRDPKKLGRVKVRIFGLHTENRSKNVDDISKHLPTNDLPWAYVGGISTNIDGISDFSTIINGTRVICVFLDDKKQHPIIISTISSFVEELPDFEAGFTDLNKEHPKEEYLNESSISRLARNEKIDETIIQTKKDNLAEFEVCGKTINEPETEFEPIYPNNKVLETASGHIMEFDDTKGKERIHIYHKSGTFVEIFPDGRVVKKSKGKSYEIYEDEKNLYIKTDLNIKVDGECNLEVDGDAQITLNGKSTITNTDDLTIDGQAKINIEGTGDVVLSGADVDISSTSNLSISSSGNVDISSSGNVNITGALVRLN